MTIFQDAQVNFVLADFANIDGVGKLNIIGGGISFIGSQGPQGPTSPFTVVASVLVPSKYVNQQYALTVELHDVTTGKVVTLPIGPAGQMQALRAQQVVNVAPVQVDQGMAVPDDVMVQQSVVMSFESGLPLPAGHSYEWKVQIDGQHRPGWWHRFHVLAPAPPPVFGGPVGGSPVIPGVGQYVVDEPEAGGAEPDASGGSSQA